ncbi:hypothetical protein Tco_0214890 [Tanacetum coccineum]
MDDALVLQEQRLQIGSCNYRLSTTFKPKEPTFHVALDVLSFSPFYLAFLITASVPAVYMHEFYATASYHKYSIRFKLNIKRYSFDLKYFPGNDLLLDLHEVVQKYGAILPDNLTTQAIKESEAYKTYYAFATRKAIPKPKIKSAAKVTKSGKKKQPAQGLETLSEIALYDDADNQDDEGQEHDEHDDEEQGDDDEQTDSDNDGDNFVHPKFSTHDEEDKEEDSFDPRVQTPSNVESTNDEDSDEEIQGTNVEGDKHDEEETNEEVKANELYRDVNVNLEGRDIEMTNAQQINDVPTIVDAYLANKMHEAVKTADQVKEQVKAQVSKILPKIEKTVNEQLKAEVLTCSSNESKTSHAVGANLSELELKKILIDKMESNKSIHKSNEQKNLYKALVDAYKSDKLILDTYRDTVLFKRRRDDEDKDEEPSAGSN